MELSIRDATIADHAFVARLFVELAVPDPVPSTEQFVSHMLPRVLIAADGTEPVGYAHYRVYGSTAHVVHLVTDPRKRGRGVGQALLGAVRRRVAGDGCARWFLNVRKNNAPAVRLYERAGMRVEYEWWPLCAEWSSLLALAGSSGASASLASPTDDALLAERFAVDAARLALARSRPGVVVIVLAEHGAPVAFGVFDPAHPGVYPVGVARLDLARPLFEALYPHARHAHVHVGVEGDRGLADFLRAAGVELLFEVVRMGASIA